MTVLAYLSHVVAYLFDRPCRVPCPCPWLWSHGSALGAHGSWFSHSSLAMSHHGTMVYHDFAREQWFSEAIVIAYERHNGFWKPSPWLRKKAMVFQSHRRGFITAIVSHEMSSFLKDLSHGTHIFFNLGTLDSLGLDVRALSFPEKIIWWKNPFFAISFEKIGKIEFLLSLLV